MKRQASYCSKSEDIDCFVRSVEKPGRRRRRRLLVVSYMWNNQATVCMPSRADLLLLSPSLPRLCRLNKRGWLYVLFGSYKVANGPVDRPDGWRLGNKIESSCLFPAHYTLLPHIKSTLPWLATWETELSLDRGGRW